MQIYYESTENCEYYYFFEVQSLPQSLLPIDIELEDFLIFVQSSLDQLRPVVILNSIDFLEKIDLLKLKSMHFSFIKNEYIFLNYSIRNSLLKNIEKNYNVQSFSEIEAFLSKTLLKN